ncbi:MAG: hypothetical protein LC104_07535 [Bacteroidales bacterium]|nr:hypothetical protein [Bacteroidales bacterium]
MSPDPAVSLATTPNPRPYTVDQAAVFRRLQSRITRNGLRVMLETGRIKLFTMLGTSALVGVFVFVLSLYTFHELFRFRVPVKGLIVGGLFDLMFFTLGIMLIFSTGIILYASLFTAPEARFLLCSPARADKVFGAKFQQAVLFSSWAFLILGLPILVSYGLVAEVPWYFYPLLPAYLLGFVLLPGSISAMACLVLVRYLPRNRRQVMILGGILLVLLGSFWLYRVGKAAKRSLYSGQRNEVEGLVEQFGLVQHPLNPSRWITEGVRAAARGAPEEALAQLALIWSNGLMIYLLAAWVAGRIYRTAFDRVAGGGRAKRRYRGSLLDHLMEGLVFYLDKPTRILIVKDFRTFRRDPTQWVLLIIFGGLLLLGATNFRQYYDADLGSGSYDGYVVSLVNVAGTSVLLCAGLSRFIFPLISLEGRKFWILGLLPVKREQILLGKFAFAATGAVLIAELLILTSDVLLRLPLPAILIHALTVAVVAVGLSALNVGLGAYMPNFRETDPSKIVVGFGGTVNMVIGLMYILLVILAMAVPLYVAAFEQWLHGNKTLAIPPLWVYAGLPVGLLFGAAAVVLPLRLGAKALRETEF